MSKFANLDLSFICISTNQTSLGAFIIAATSSGNAIHIDNEDNSKNDANLTTNGTVSNGNALAGSYAIKADGNTDLPQTFTLTNQASGTINGSIYAPNWNSNSTFTNHGTLNLQNGAVDTSPTFINNISLNSNSVLKIDINSKQQADSLKTNTGLIGLNIATKIGEATAGLSASLRHEFGDVNQAHIYKLAGSATTYSSSTPAEARNKIVLNADVSIAPTINSSLTFSTFGEKSTTSLNLGASASYKIRF